MKALLLALVMVVALAATAYADSDITFAWNPNSEADLAGYRLYRTATPGEYTFGADEAIATIAAGTETVTASTPDGLWYFVVTAYDNDDNESGPSNEVTPGELDSTAPEPPGGLNITVIVKILISLLQGETLRVGR